MSTLRQRLRLPATIVLAATLAIATPLTLSGCGLIGGVVHQATGGGVPGLPGGSVPADFPKDIPLIKGDVQLGVALGDSKDGKVWNVTIKTTDTNAGVTIKGQMEAAGFKVQGDGTSSDGSGAAYLKDKLAVVVVVGTSDNDIIVNYTATETK
jgi:hypothetical protein